MFGVYRTFLSLMVMAFHLLAIRVIGQYAVFSFFVLSGFLMTTIMHDTYGYTSTGRRNFAINRFLRLYPSYWLALLASIAIIFFCGQSFVSSYKLELQIPTTLPILLANVTMIFADFIPMVVAPRLSPPTWALTVELIYYALIAIGVSRSLKATWCWFGVSVLYVILTFILQLSWDYRYAAIPAGSLPFSMGALLYFYKADINTFLNKKLARWGSWHLFAIYVANVAIFTGLGVLFRDKAPIIWGQYINLLITSVLIIKLYYAGLPVISRKFDKIVGDYSYPIYLLHWQIGALSSFLIFQKPVLGLTVPSLLVFVVATLLVFIASSILIYGLDPLIEKMRKKVKARSQAHKKDETTEAARQTA